MACLIIPCKHLLTSTGCNMIDLCCLQNRSSVHILGQLFRPELPYFSIAQLPMIGHGFPIAERLHFARQKPHAVHLDSWVLTLGPPFTDLEWRTLPLRAWSRKILWARIVLKHQEAQLIFQMSRGLLWRRANGFQSVLFEWLQTLHAEFSPRENKQQHACIQTFNRSFSRHEGGGAQQSLGDRFQTLGFGASWCAVSVI